MDRAGQRQIRVAVTQCGRSPGSRPRGSQATGTPASMRATTELDHSQAARATPSSGTARTCSMSGVGDRLGDRRLGEAEGSTASQGQGRHREVASDETGANSDPVGEDQLCSE